jgi:hypothetical protein
VAHAPSIKCNTGKETGARGVFEPESSRKKSASFAAERLLRVTANPARVVPMVDLLSLMILLIWSDMASGVQLLRGATPDNECSDRPHELFTEPGTYGLPGDSMNSAAASHGCSHFVATCTGTSIPRAAAC